VRDCVGRVVVSARRLSHDKESVPKRTSQAA
jgi:hypothetical protein